MDPVAALKWAANAINSGDYASARQYLNGYAAWRRRGGFEPSDGDATLKRLRKLMRGLGKTRAKNPARKRKTNPFVIQNTESGKFFREDTDTRDIARAKVFKTRDAAKRRGKQANLLGRFPHKIKAVRARTKNPAPKKAIGCGVVIRARKGATTLFYDGQHFKKSGAVIFSSVASARAMATHLIKKFPVLKQWNVSVNFK